MPFLEPRKVVHEIRNKTSPATPLVKLAAVVYIVPSFPNREEAKSFFSQLFIRYHSKGFVIPPADVQTECLQQHLSLQDFQAETTGMLCYFYKYHYISYVIDRTLSPTALQNRYEEYTPITTKFNNFKNYLKIYEKTLPKPT